MALLGAVVVAGLVAWGVRRLDQIDFVDVPGVEPAADGEAANWLLIGTDGREGIDPGDPNAGAFLGEEVVGKRTDTIIIARVDRAAQRIDLLSIPRDLWVPIAGRDGEGRINGAYNGEGGRERLVATLEMALGLEINNYAEVNFVGFQQIVDAVDGVPLWFEHPARDLGSGLDIVEPGCHVLDGSQALAYARARTYEQLVDGAWQLDPSGDLGRTARQRRFLTEVIDAATGKIGVTQLGTVDEMLVVGGRNLVVEDGADIADLLSLARTFASVGGDGIVDHSLPIEDFRTEGGAQVLRLRPAEADAVLDGFRTGRPPAGPSAVGGGDSAGGGEAVSEGGAAETTAAEVAAPSDELPDATGALPDAPGYGRFGFTPGPGPDGTPCG